jgi:hypothetical protein
MFLRYSHLQMTYLEWRDGKLERMSSCGMTSEEVKANDSQRRELASYLYPIWTPEMRRIEEEKTKLLAPRNVAEQENLRKLEIELDDGSIALLETLLGTEICLRYKRPGEMVLPGPNAIYVPWHPTRTLPAYSHASQEPDESLEELESIINNSIKGLEVYPGVLNKREINEVERELEKIMFPDLRRLRDLYLWARARRSGRKADAEELDLKFAHDRSCRTWVNSLLDAGDHIRRTHPLQPDERSGILYLRRLSAELDSEVHRSVKELEDDINRELRKTAQVSESPREPRRTETL